MGIIWRDIMFSYQTFLDEKGGVLSFEQCQEYHQKILDGMKKGDAELEQYWLDFVKNAIEYTQIRSKWYLISREERQATDGSRTNKHNQVIMALHRQISSHLYQILQQNR